MSFYCSSSFCSKNISPDFAKKLEYALGIDAIFWINLQTNYDKELLEFATKNMIPISIYEQNEPHLLHGKIGAYIAKNKYKIEVLDVLNAIKWHTTGKANMTKLEQIIFCADYIEPGRNVQPNLSYLREISHKDLDLLTFNILKDTLEYLKTKEQIIDNHTVEAYEFYKKKIGEK